MYIGVLQEQALKMVLHGQLKGNVLIYFNQGLHYLYYAALVICCFGIRGFAYSRMQKPQITRGKCHF